MKGNMFANAAKQTLAETLFLTLCANVMAKIQFGELIKEP